MEPKILAETDFVRLVRVGERHFVVENKHKNAMREDSWIAAKGSFDLDLNYWLEGRWLGDLLEAVVRRTR